MQYFLPSLQTKPYVHFLFWEVERKSLSWLISEPLEPQFEVSGAKRTSYIVIIMYRQMKGEHRLRTRGAYYYYFLTAPYFRGKVP